MTINIMIGFIVPWLLGSILYNKNKKIIFIIAPFTVTISHIVNSLGFYLDFWVVTPISLYTISLLPADIGLYPILASYMIYLIHQKKATPYLLILSFTLFITLLEYLGVLYGKIVYSNGWDIYLTFLSYLFSYFITYWYYYIIKNLKVF